MKIVAVRYRNVFLFSAVVFLLFLAYEFLIAGAEEPLELVQGVKDLDTFCSKVAEDCYFVKQEVKRDKSVLRYIESEKYSRDGMFKMTIVPLEVESNKVVINRKSLSSQYISVMATFPYAIGALRFDAPGQKVLSIGLGGGSLDMFLRITRPELDITVVELDPTILEMATRWFGVVEDEKRRTIVADGIDFLEKAALKGDTFDVIALDACNSGDDVHRCPAFAFYAAETMENTKKAMSDDGVFILNVLASNVSELAHVVKEHFATCFISQMWSSNIVIACLKKRKEMTSYYSSMFHVQFGTAMAKQGLNPVIGQIVFSQF